jgi:predicted RNA-binding Zn-ribbon protein involved in translation (DUF1610 family)
MSAPIRIDLTAATPTEVPADDLATGEATLAWLCPVCGKLRVFEGGRPSGLGHQDECEECGCRLAVASLVPAAVARRGAGRESLRALIDSNWF